MRAIFMRGRHGFTLLEIIIVMSILSIVSGGIFFALAFSVPRAQLDASTSQVIIALRSAQRLSIAGAENATWGVSFDVTERAFTLFKGLAFVERDTTYDDAYALSPRISFGGIAISGGGTEIVFRQQSGAANQAGTITVSDGAKEKIVTVNSAGLVQ